MVHSDRNNLWRARLDRKNDNIEKIHDYLASAGLEQENLAAFWTTLEGKGAFLTRCVIGAHLVVTNAHEREFLLVSEHSDGYYGFPGGKAEDGETFFETLSRECKEEGCASLLQDWVFADCSLGVSTYIDEESGVIYVCVYMVKRSVSVQEEFMALKYFFGMDVGLLNTAASDTCLFNMRVSSSTLFVESASLDAEVRVMQGHVRSYVTRVLAAGIQHAMPMTYVHLTPSAFRNVWEIIADLRPTNWIGYISQSLGSSSNELERIAQIGRSRSGLKQLALHLGIFLMPRYIYLHRGGDHDTKYIIKKWENAVAQYFMSRQDLSLMYHNVALVDEMITSYINQVALPVYNRRAVRKIEHIAGADFSTFDSIPASYDLSHTLKDFQRDLFSSRSLTNKWTTNSMVYNISKDTHYITAPGDDHNVMYSADELEFLFFRQVEKE